MIGQDAALDSAGNIYILGKPANNNVHILKYNPSGSIIWSRELATVNSNRLYAASDKYGNIYFSFCDDNDSHFRLTKYDSSGNFQWNRFFVPGGYNTYTQAIALDTSGNIFLIGGSQISAGHPFILKYNAQGDLLWSASPSISGNDFLWSGFVDRPGNVYVAGYCADSNNYTFDYLTIKFNNDGVQQWAKRYNGPANGWDEAVCVKADNEGYCYVTGGASTGINHLDFCTIKYTPNGDSVWTRLYTPQTERNWSSGIDMIIDENKNIYIAGEGGDTNLSGSLIGGFQLIKYDRDGNIIFNVIDTNGRELAPICKIKNNIYLSGTCKFGNSIYLSGYNNTGNIIFISFYPPYNDTLNNYYNSNKILSYKNNNLFIIGGSLDSSVLMKYSENTGIVKTNQNIVSGFRLFQNYPNPFNPKTRIKYEISKNSFVTLKVFNIIGKEISILVNEKKVEGIYEINFNGNYLPSGIYFYSLFVNGQKIDIKKMLLIK
jgi:hypothetical protein